MEPFPDILVVRVDNMGTLTAVCSGCVKEGEKVEGNLTAIVHTEPIDTFRGYATTPDKYECPRCDSTHERSPSTRRTT